MRKATSESWRISLSVSCDTLPILPCRGDRRASRPGRLLRSRGGARAAPSSAAQPLVVGGDPRGRGVVATANYVARGLRYPLGDELCRGAAALPARRLRRRRGTGTYARVLAPRVGGRSARSSRRSSGPGSTRATSTSARWRRTTASARVVAEAVQAAVRGATSLSCSLGVASCKVVAKVASDRKQAGRDHGRPAGREAAFLAPFPVRLLPGRRPEGRGAARGRGRRARSASSRRSPTRDLARLLPGKIGRLLRDRAQGIDPRPLEEPVANISISQRGDVPARRLRPRAAPRRAAPDGPPPRRATSRSPARSRGR